MKQPMKHDPNDPHLLDTLAAMVRERHAEATTKRPCPVCHLYRLREGERWEDDGHASSCGVRRSRK